MAYIYIFIVMWSCIVRLKLCAEVHASKLRRGGVGATEGAPPFSSPRRLARSNFSGAWVRWNIER